MKKDKNIFPEDLRKRFAERDHLLINELSDGKGSTCSYFELIETSLEGFRCVFDRFKHDIMPYLPWKKINDVFLDLPRKTNKENIEWIVFMLMPVPIEHMIFEEMGDTKIRVDESELDRTFEKIYGQRLTKMASQIIKLRSGLKGQLEKLQAEIYAYDEYTPIYWKQYEPLTLVIGELEKEIDKFTVLKNSAQKRVEIRKKLYSFDLNSNKSPKKQRYWNKTIPQGLKVLNRFCHTDKCKKPCSKTHKTAYEKIALLLKILYPRIWPDDIKTIANQIKSREHRAI